jgi:HAD superfamily hydrolase (TIGR01549 family)
VDDPRPPRVGYDRAMPLAIFDLDNTLIDRSASVRRWAAEFLELHRLDPGEAAWLIEADGDGVIPRPSFFGSVRERYGFDQPLERLLADYRERIVALIDLDPAVPDALGRLRGQGWRIAIATNGTTDQQLAKIHRVGLGDHVDAVAVSEEVGAAKPDRRVFEVAAQRCGAGLADGGWMVGDCPVRDIAGGRAAGLATIWVHRGRAWDGSAPSPDAVVDDVSESVGAMSAA